MLTCRGWIQAVPESSAKVGHRNSMKSSFIYRAHIWLGLIIAVPVFAWASSGLLYAWPNAVDGGKVQTIEPGRVRITPGEALRRADGFMGRELPTTALTLLMREGHPVYQAVGGMGAGSVLIDAETGAVMKTPSPGLLTRYFRQAHFYFFAGSWQVPLLIAVSALACLSALSGIYLNASLWRARLRRRATLNNRKDPFRDAGSA